ncbi:SGNH/GDSL hydrolase family protein [Zavarzinella formosa]|uniref:SGNH/GDSL hydrolase family protein n=1 Tax=Zavarzinella formosa TaxID=360055 RepID=UPI0002D895F6|nr:SGNH/GDSL hydrolase family protein [Zavarzinella formosa]
MHSPRLLVCCILFAGTIRAAEPPGGGRESVIKMLPELHLLEPAWVSPVVYRESSILFQKDEKAPVVARLAFPATEILSVKSAAGEKTYEAGKDFQLGEGGLTLVFKPEAKAPVLTEAALYPPEGAPMSYRHRASNPKQNMLYGPGRWFHDRQIEITYRTKPASGTLPAITLADKQLPKTFARLREGKPLVIGISGDSISTGLDASALVKAPPQQPGYPDLVAAQLQHAYKSEITLKNRAVSGWSIANGVADHDKLLVSKPNLVIIAYGMNDVGRRDPKWYKEQTQKLIEQIHAADKYTEIILVSTMTGNPEWVHTPKEMFPKYQEALASLAGPGIALADVTAAWETMLKNKHYLDLTGNGLNHPNDFGHRLYAQTILSLLVAKP